MKRIAVIGWTGSSISSESSVTDFYAWETPEDTVNLKDYDTWVLLPDTLQPTIPQGSVWDLLSIEYVYDALLHYTVIYVVGDPRDDVHLEGWGASPFLHWTGLAIDWDSAKSTLQFTNPSELDEYKVKGYLTSKVQWEYAIDNAYEHAKTAESPLFRSPRANFRYHIERVSLTVNRYQRQIASAFRLDLQEKSSRGEWYSEKSFGRIVVIPGSRSEVADYLAEFLREALDVSLTEEPPSWVEELVAPNQAEIDQQMVELEEQRRILDGQISVLLEEREVVRECLEILYQIGPSLEKSVVSILHELGGAVELPKEQNREDGWLTVNTSADDLFEGVMEIKSSRKAQFDSYGLKQLLEWVNRGIELRTKKYKPIFIGNSLPSVSPHSRPFPFQDNWIKQAELAKVVALTTTTLFTAYELHQAGTLDRELFWKRIFSTSGVFGESDLPLLAIDSDKHLV